MDSHTPRPHRVRQARQIPPPIRPPEEDNVMVDNNFSWLSESTRSKQPVPELQLAQGSGYLHLKLARLSEANKTNRDDTRHFQVGAGCGRSGSHEKFLTTITLSSSGGRLKTKYQPTIHQMIAEVKARGGIVDCEPMQLDQGSAHGVINGPRIHGSSNKLNYYPNQEPGYTGADKRFDYCTRSG